ncbi:MAG: homocitrate synthase [Bacillota bacterium]|nr:homocitrate synthase [Bacillota bacterium]
MSGRRIFVVDTTLRDGEQTAGVVFTPREKEYIACLLDDLGVDEIEAGVPVMEGAEKEAVRTIAHLGLRARVMAWNRALPEDLRHSLDCGAPAVALSISASDIQIEKKLRTTRRWVLDTMARTTEMAKKQGLYVSVSAEDASRADPAFLVEFARTARDAGADRLRFCDTVGLMHPLAVHEAVGRLLQGVPGLPVEMHTHNDLGLATANALAGVMAGASFVGVTVGGLGERAGNAALEEVVMGLKHLLGYETGVDTRYLARVAEYVGAAAGRPVPPGKSVVGPGVFAHESGIHVDGVLKDPSTYEPFDPGEVGLVRRLVVGKHSGAAAVLDCLRRSGIEADGALIPELLARVRQCAIDLKRSLQDWELARLYRKLQE